MTLRRTLTAAAAACALLVGCAPGSGSSPTPPAPTSSTSTSGTPSVPASASASPLIPSHAQTWTYTDGSGHSFTASLTTSDIVPASDLGADARHPSDSTVTLGGACTFDAATAGVIAAVMTVTPSAASGDLRPAVMLRAALTPRYPYTVVAEVPYSGGYACKDMDRYTGAGFTMAWSRPLSPRAAITVPFFVVVEKMYPTPSAAKLGEGVFRMLDVVNADRVSLTPSAAGLTLTGRAV
jgi:hypothetical protein